jgi:hypothetical protein
MLYPEPQHLQPELPPVTVGSGSDESAMIEACQKRLR